MKPCTSSLPLILKFKHNFPLSCLPLVPLTSRSFRSSTAQVLPFRPHALSLHLHATIPAIIKIYYAFSRRQQPLSTRKRPPYLSATRPCIQTPRAPITLSMNAHCGKCPAPANAMDESQSASHHIGPDQESFQAVVERLRFGPAPGARNIGPIRWA
jgi:hypothetical protein